MAPLSKFPTTPALSSSDYAVRLAYERNNMAGSWPNRHANSWTGQDVGTSVEAGVMELQERMQTGCLTVFSTLEPWFEEFRMYHRKNGIIVKERDDLLSATRYALMMRRFAKPTDRNLGSRRRHEVMADGISYDVFGCER